MWHIFNHLSIISTNTHFSNIYYISINHFDTNLATSNPQTLGNCGRKYIPYIIFNMIRVDVEVHPNNCKVQLGWLKEKSWENNTKKCQRNCGNYNLTKIDKAYEQKPINKQKSETFGLHLQYKTITDGLRQSDRHLMFYKYYFVAWKLTTVPFDYQFFKWFFKKK